MFSSKNQNNRNNLGIKIKKEKSSLMISLKILLNQFSNQDNPFVLEAILISNDNYLWVLTAVWWLEDIQRILWNSCSPLNKKGYRISRKLICLLVILCIRKPFRHSDLVFFDSSRQYVLGIEKFNQRFWCPIRTYYYAVSWNNLPVAFAGYKFEPNR